MRLYNDNSGKKIRIEHSFHTFHKKWLERKNSEIERRRKKRKKILEEEEEENKVRKLVRR